MFSHIFVGVSEFDRALAFYIRLMAALGSQRWHVRGGASLRPEYHEHYYGAYFRDPDGNKLCVACHSPQR